MTREGARLHPHVVLEVRGDPPLGPGGFELHDGRTDFRIAIDDAAPPADRALDGELAALCDELGLLDEDLSLDEVRLRQHRFTDAQAWDERLERLRALLAFVTEKVPYYRARAARYAPETIASPTDLRSLPLLRKPEVRAAFLDLVSDDVDVPAATANGTIELVATSGTTEERLQALSDATLVRIPSSYDAIFDVAAVRGVPRTAVFTSVTCLAGGCSLGPGSRASRLVHDFTLYLPTVRDPFALDRDTVRAIADEMEDFEPTFLFVNPAYAHLLARRAAELDVSLPKVRVILSSYQYASRLQRRALETTFGGAVRDLYAATELGGCQMGLECSRGRLHVREDHCLVEVIRGAAEAEPGTVGAVVVTTLASTTMPLVRYAVGDLAERIGTPCDCPLSPWPSIRLHGRERDALHVGGRAFTTRDVDEIIGLEPGVDFYCCRQTSASELRVEVVPALDRALRPEALARRIEDAIPMASVQVREVRRLEPAPSLKYPLSARELPAPPWLA